MIRTDAQLTVSRFCELIGLSRRSFYDRRSAHRDGPRRKGPWPTPALDAIDADVVRIAEARPSWGHRKVWAMLRESGHDRVSLSSVKRTMARHGLLLPIAGRAAATPASRRDLPSAGATVSRTTRG